MTDTEINEAVARKLGWKKFDQHYQYWIPLTIEATQKYGDRPSDLPLYTKSIEAAWEIVDHLTKSYNIALDHWERKVTAHLTIEEQKEWRFFIRTEPYGGIEAFANTAPMAITLAFLKLP